MNDHTELKHYGVVGMKWNVRRARKADASGKSDKATKIYSKTFSKSTDKLNKLYQKSAAKNLKSAKLQKRALKKAMVFELKMNNNLAFVPVDKIDKASLEKGKNYTYMLMRNKVVDKKAEKQANDYWNKAMEYRYKDDKKSSEYERKSILAELKSFGYTEEEIKKMHLPY